VDVFKMAWRNVWRNRRRTLVTVAAMALALLVMILYNGLMEGYLLVMERNVLDLEMGDVQVFAPGYQDKPSIYTRIQDTGALLARLDRLGYPASGRLIGGGLAAAGDASAGVTLRGLVVERDAAVSQIYKHVGEGQWLASDRPGEAVLGRRLARTLGIKPGDELVVLGQAADGSIANELYTVRGVLKGVSDVTDRSGIFLTAEAFREFFILPSGEHQIIVRRPADLDLTTVASTIRDLAPKLEVKTWRELMPTIASMMDSMRGVTYTVFFIVYIAIGILILNAMLMAVFERIREFGVLKALGVGPGHVLGLILTESAFQTGLAILAGLTLSLPGLWYLTRVGINMGTLGGMSIMGLALDPVWRTVVTPNTFIHPVLILILIVSVAVLYPALKAAWISPLKAIRHQ